MDLEALRKICLTFPHATEQIQWGNDLLFKVGGKMFALAPLEPAPICVTFKCSPEVFAELVERQEIIPAPYLARVQWVALESWTALSTSELADLLRNSYELVFAKLPAGIRSKLAFEGPSGRQAPSSRTKRRKGSTKGKRRVPR